MWRGREHARRCALDLAGRPSPQPQRCGVWAAPLPFCPFAPAFLRPFGCSSVLLVPLLLVLVVSLSAALDFCSLVCRDFLAFPLCLLPFPPTFAGLRRSSPLRCWGVVLTLYTFFLAIPCLFAAVLPRFFSIFATFSPRSRSLVENIATFAQFL